MESNGVSLSPISAPLGSNAAASVIAVSAASQRRSFRKKAAPLPFPAVPPPAPQRLQRSASDMAGRRTADTAAHLQQHQLSRDNILGNNNHHHRQHHDGSRNNDNIKTHSEQLVTSSLGRRQQQQQRRPPLRRIPTPPTRDSPPALPPRRPVPRTPGGAVAVSSSSSSSSDIVGAAVSISAGLRGRDSQWGCGLRGGGCARRRLSML